MAVVRPPLLPDPIAVEKEEKLWLIKLVVEINEVFRKDVETKLRRLAEERNPAV